MAESRTGPKFGHPTLFLFLAYFSFTSPFLLDLHDVFTTCSMTNTTVTSDLAPPPNHGLSPLPRMVRKGA